MCYVVGVIGIIGATSTTYSMKYFKKQAGTASAVIGSLSFWLGALAGMLLNSYQATNAIPMCSSVVTVYWSQLCFNTVSGNPNGPEHQTATNYFLQDRNFTGSFWRVQEFSEDIVVRQFIWSLILQIIWSKICLFFILNYDNSHYLISVSSHWRYQKSSNCLNASVHSFWFFFLQIIRMQNQHIYSMLLFTVVELI